MQSVHIFSENFPVYLAISCYYIHINVVDAIVKLGKLKFGFLFKFIHLMGFTN